MTQLSKEPIAEIIEGLEQLANRGIQSVHIDMAIAGMRRLIAVEGQEPVAEIRAYYPLGIDGGKQKFIQPCGELPDFGAKLYAAPQPVAVPVVNLPPEFYSSEGVVVQLEKVMAALAVCGIKYERKGNACRAAMLKGDKS